MGRGARGGRRRYLYMGKGDRGRGTPACSDPVQIVWALFCCVLGWNTGLAILGKGLSLDTVSAKPNFRTDLDLQGKKKKRLESSMLTETQFLPLLTLFIPAFVRNNEPKLIHW